MTVSYTSPNGETTVEVITVDGKQYDLPPWIEEDDFCAGVQSTDNTNALSSLTSCTLVKWMEDPLGGSDAVLPIFEVEYFVPFNSAQELAVNAFTPVDKLYGGNDMTWEFTDTGVKLTLTAMEYFDFHDVQVFLIPEDVNQFTLDEDDVEDHFYKLYELQEYFSDVEAEAKDEWSDVFERITGPDCEPYILFVHFHED